IEKGEVHLLFGPNGAGKSTLLRTIIGLPTYAVERGRIIFDGVDITNKKPYERALMGIAFSYQNPPPLHTKFNYIAKLMTRKYNSRLDYILDLNLDNLIERRLHDGFSGGESKRAELAMVLLQKPKLALLDEPDSGVDIDSMELIANAINRLIEMKSTILMVTHTGFIAFKIKRIDKASVMVNGRIVYTGEFEEVYDMIMKKGYKGFGHE
ncbi:MAG: ABC transporter ATP-binding protein, partial [Thermoprotei archaeon]